MDCTQTRRINQTKEPELVAPAMIDPLRQEPDGNRRKAREGREPDPQRTMIMALPGGKGVTNSPSRRDAAEAARHRKAAAEIAALTDPEQRKRAWMDHFEQTSRTSGGRGPP